MSYNSINIKRIEVTEVENLYSDRTKDLNGRAFKSELKILSKNPNERLSCKFMGIAIETEDGSDTMNCQVKYYCKHLGIKGDIEFVVPNNFQEQGVANYAKSITAKALLQKGLIKELREAEYNRK